MITAYTKIESMIGDIYLVVDEIGVRKLELFEDAFEKYLFENKHMVKDHIICRDAARELEEYFSGKRKVFEVPLHIEGTEFRKRVWKALLDIPYGEVRSYKDIAVSIGNPKGVRAVGQANRCNEIPIIIPCHRVLGMDGKLVGYAGTRTDIKEKLLKLEGII